MADPYGVPQAAPQNAGVKVPEIPADLLGPTGLVFIHPDKTSYSTELNITLQGEDGRYYNVPLLVPGQQNINALLAGQRPTDDQVDRAVAYAKTVKDLPTFGSVDEALAAGKAHHDAIEKQLEQYVAPLLTGRKPSPTALTGRWAVP